MNRRAFLARSLRLPAAVAALPFLGGLATFAETTEPEAQAGIEPSAFSWWQITSSGGQLFFHDLPEPGPDAAGVWRFAEGAYGEGIALAERNVLVRDKLGAIVRWGLDTGPNGWPVRP
jgi:hypothetical protein